MKISVDCFDDHHMSATTIAAMPSPIERISCLQASQVAYLFTSNFLDELQKNIFELKQEVSDWPFLLTNETGCVLLIPKICKHIHINTQTNKKLMEKKEKKKRQRQKQKLNNSFEQNAIVQKKKSKKKYDLESFKSTLLQFPMIE